jgi:phospholipid/cholesterol/gamma-HCH transport system substrate-binding protein
MRVETKVGLLFIAASVLVVLFAYVLGAFNPFSNTHDVYVAYNFAGGIEIGSPVRVMGIKVGKVKDIEFDPGLKDEDGKEVKLKVKVSISKDAWPTVRKDSRFFINLAGIIGEKFLEISPGSTESRVLEPGEIVRGEDPPRIDQLISQSYGLAGKILEFVENNEEGVTHTLKMFDKLLVNFNKTLTLLERSGKNVDVAQFVKNMAQITGDVAAVSHKLRTQETDKTIDLIYRLLWRLEELDKEAIKKFFQEEGIKAELSAF